MICPSCETEHTGVRHQCQPPQGASGIVAVPRESAPARMTALGMLGICAVVLLGLLYASVVPTNETNSATRTGYRVGTFIGAMFFPTIIAYVVAGRRKVRNWKRFASIFFISGFIFLALSWLGATNALNVEAPEQRIGRLMREAAGTQPIRNPGIGKQREFDDAIREQFRNLIQVNRDYIAAAEKLNLNDTEKLNSPGTFADPYSATEALNQLHAAYNLDAQQEQKINEVIEKLRDVMRSSASSPAAQQAMLNSFDKSVATQTSKRQRLLSTEKAWMDAEDDLYGFAGQHRSDIKLAGSQIAIANDAVREQFNQKIGSEEAFRQDFLKTKQQFSSEQAKLLGSYGLDQKAVGAQ
jgi:hypothetical protein